MKKADKERILNLLDEAEFSGKLSDYQHVFYCLTEMKNQYENDPDFQYLYGYTSLFFPDEEKFYREMALIALKKTLELDPNNKNAYFHLINCHYELRHYKNALDGYIKILEMLRVSENQTVSLSIFERILSCFLHLNQHVKFLENFSLWIRAYRSTQDIESMTLPRELIFSVYSYLKDKGEDMSSDAKKLFKNVTIDLLSLFDNFPISRKEYKEVIEVFKNWDGQYSGPYIYELIR